MLLEEEKPLHGASTGDDQRPPSFREEDQAPSRSRNALLAALTSPLFCSIALVALLYAVCILSGNMRFLTNDDTSIQDALAGNLTGDPYPFHPFISPLLGTVMSALYRSVPGHPWWFFYSHVFMAIGSVMMSYVLLRLFKAARLPQLVALGLVAIFDLIFFLYPIMNVSFTVVPCVFGMGVAGLLALYGTRRSYLSLICICMATAFLCTCHRSESGMVVCAFLCLALLVCASRELCKGADPVSPEEREPLWRRVPRIASHYLPAVVACIVITLLIPQYNSATMAHVDSPEYASYNSSRSQFNDYPHDSYDDNPTLYREVGWDRDLFELARVWFFMDDAITQDAFDHISEGSRLQAHSTNLSDLQSRTTDLFENQYLIPCFVACGMCLFVSALALCHRRDGYGFLALMVDVLLMLLLIFSQLYTGRALYRSILITLFPTALLALVLAFWSDDAIDLDARWSGPSSRARYFPACLGTIVLLLLCPRASDMCRATFDPQETLTYEKTSEVVRSVTDYLYAHPDNLYVRKPTLMINVNPFILSSREAPHNCISWGGAEWNSDLQKSEFAVAGVTQENAELFKHDNVFILSTMEPYSIDVGWGGGDITLFHLFRHLRDHYGATRIECADTICEGIYVYQIKFDAPVWESDGDLYE